MVVLPLMPVSREEEPWNSEQAGLGAESSGLHEASRTGVEGTKLRLLVGRGEVEVSRRVSPDPKAGGTRPGVWTEDWGSGAWL